MPARGGSCAAAVCAPCELAGLDGREGRVLAARHGACRAPWSEGRRCRVRKTGRQALTRKVRARLAPGIGRE
eukprot:112435-Prymnesium_polylepis.1